MDIEELAAKNDTLAVKGQAGSGKTTLMKHLAYSIIKKENAHGLNEYLPVFLVLNELQEVLNKEDKIIGAPMAERFLDAYFRETDNGLDMETVYAFCNAGRAIFIIDGLDETDPDSRKKIVGSLSDFRKNNKMVLCGRPPGIEGIVAQKFGDRLVEINGLNEKQIKRFIENWFKYDVKLTREGKTPQGMMDEMRALEESHQDIKRLVETPLMLTAVCILYHYDRKLPDQRVELYEKFVGNLIYKRYKDPTKVENFLMKLAFEVHQSETAKKKEERTRSFNRDFALKILEEFFPKNEKETDLDYGAGISRQFDEIEQNCGLLRVENRQYLFWHLSFQEFLAARYIQNRRRNPTEEIKKYWDNDWHEEVVKLFIGSLSYSNNNGDANGAVADLRIISQRIKAMISFLMKRSKEFIMRESTQTPGKKAMRRIILIPRSGAVRGTTSVISPGAPPASGTPRTFGSTISGFVAPGL